MNAPRRPIPTRVMVFVDAQNLYHRCKSHFGHPWAHPRALADALVGEDCAAHGDTHVLAGVRYYTDLFRLGYKGLYDVAIIVSEDSDLDPAAQEVYALRDRERWIAVENALPWGPNSHT